MSVSSSNIPAASRTPTRKADARTRRTVNIVNFRVLLATSALFSAAAIAAPSIDPQFGPHAVIQRNWPINLSGSATPGEKLTVSFGGQNVTATTDKAGRWEASFSPRADGKNLELSVTGPDYGPPFTRGFRVNGQLGASRLRRKCLRPGGIPGRIPP